MGFRSLQHIRESRVHLPRALPARYVPPSGFGYPLDGLLPAVPRRFCFAPAALLGFTLRSFLLPEGIQPVSEWKNPHTVSPVGIPSPKLGPARQAAVPGFQPFRESLATHVCLAHEPLDAPLGFALPGSSRMPWPGFRPASSHAIPGPGLRQHRLAPEYRSASAPSRPSIRASPHGLIKTTLVGFHTGRGPDIRTRSHPGYFFRLAPRRALLSTAEAL